MSMTTNKQALREELLNPAIGTREHLRKLSLALLDELEAEQRISSTWRKTAESNSEKLEAAERRIAELEEREIKVKQFTEFQICHYGASEDYAKGYIDCQKNYNKALGAANILVGMGG